MKSLKKKSLIIIFSVMLFLQNSFASLAMVSNNYIANGECADESGEVFEIIAQPESTSAVIGEEVSFSVKAEGTEISYCWYRSFNDGDSWEACKTYSEMDADGGGIYSEYKGADSSCLTMNVSIENATCIYKCILKNNYESILETEVVGINLEVPVIIEQPDDLIRFDVGDTISLSIKALGVGLSFKWYESENEGISWEESLVPGHDSNILALSNLDIKDSGKMFYCEIYDVYGNQIKSQPIVVKLEEETNKYTLVNNREILDFEREICFDCEQLLNSLNIGEKLIFNVGLSDVEVTDCYLFVFSAISESVCTSISFQVNGNNDYYIANYPVQVYEENYILPISGISSIDMITISVDGDYPIDIGNFELVRLGNVDVADYKTGIFKSADDSTVLEYDSGVGYMATDSAIYDDKLFTVYQGVLTVYSISDYKNPVILNSISGLGDTRDISINETGEILFVASREDGFFIVDISDVYNLCIIRNIDTLGLATGLTVSGNYCFVTSRRHGLEIYDISRLKSPKFCAQIYEDDEEFFDCVVENGYLYVTSWAEKKVHIYSLANVCNPKMISTISLDGNGAGCTVDDNKLYVATGYNSGGISKSKNDLNYGMGNGLEIFDVTNPESPQWMSSSKIDGRYFISGFDHWRVVVSEGIAYVSSAYAGVYVYNVNNAYAPKRIEKISINIPVGHKKYKKIENTKYLLPYNQNEYVQSLMTSVTISDGSIFITTHTGDKYKSLADANKNNAKTGLYVLERNYASKVKNISSTLFGTIISDSGNMLEIKGYESIFVPDVNQAIIHSIAYFKGNIFLAEGASGLYMYNPDSRELSKIPKIGTVNSIVVVGDYMYVSEAGIGLRAYAFESNELKMVTYYRISTDNVIANMHASPDGKYLLAQNGLYNYLVIDISSPPCIKLLSKINTGAMYYNNITNDSTENGVMGISNRNTLIFYTLDDDNNPYIMNEVDNKYYLESGGITGYKDYIIQIYLNGYIYYNPTLLTNENIKNVKRIKKTDWNISGTPKVVGNTMYVCDSIGRKLSIIDISNIDEPMMSGQISFDANPDNIYYFNNTLILSLAHKGLLFIKERKE